MAEPLRRRRNYGTRGCLLTIAALAAVLLAIELVIDWADRNPNHERLPAAPNDLVPAPRQRDGRARPALGASPFQAVERDFAFVINTDVGAEAVVRAAQSADKKLIAGVSVFDQYGGEELGAGKKSIAISVRLEPAEATLTEAEIEAVSAKVIAAVNKATGGVLRS